MRNRKGLRSVEALLILVIIVIIGGVGCSRQEVGRSLGNAGEAWESRAKQSQQLRGRPERTDETADWITYVSSEGRFSLRHPKYWAVGPRHPQYCTDKGSFFMAGAGADFVAECGTEYFGQIYVSSKEGNQLSNHKLTASEYPYQNITSRKVTVDNIEGTRETGTAMGQMDEKFAMPGLPDGTKVVIYLLYAHGRSYVAQYTQRIGDPDILRDFDIMVTKTLKFGN
jgi:hypothetical protein